VNVQVVVAAIIVSCVGSREGGMARLPLSEKRKKWLMGG
jgi:hypothetical protein